MNDTITKLGGFHQWMADGCPVSSRGKEGWIADRIDSYWTRLDRMPDCETRRELIALDEEGQLGSTFRAMAEIEWERRS